MNVQPLREIAGQILGLIKSEGEPTPSPDEIEVSSRAGPGPARAVALGSFFGPIRQKWKKAKLILAVAERGAVIGAIQEGFDCVEKEIEKLWSCKNQEETRYGNVFVLHEMGKLMMMVREFCTEIDANQSDKNVSPVLYPANYIQEKHGLPANTLNKARREGRLRGEKRGGRWFYPLETVRLLWPDAFPEDDQT
jgi:hypothetical protein